MVDSIFSIVQKFLEWIAKKPHRTFNEINIIMYYFLVPFTWCMMIDFAFSLPFIFSLGYSLFSLIVVVKSKNFTKFSDWLFDKSADFIEFFGDYYVFSVVLCVALTLLIYILLAILIYYNH